MGDQSNMTGRGSVGDVTARLKAAKGAELEALIARYADDPRTGVRHAVSVASRRLDAERRVAEETAERYRLMGELAGGGVAVGVDEVGRGAIAGPLTVCAVCLPQEPVIIGIDDSKRLAPERRAELAERIEEVATAIGIAHVPPSDIDRDGMAVSLRRAMAAAVEGTGIDPDVVLIDGNPVHAHPRERCIVKGDAKVACISAASIVAKVTRDRMMVAADAEYPGYSLARCKGYASPEHMAAIRAHGLTELHRKTFCQGILERQDSLF